MKGYTQDSSYTGRVLVVDTGAILAGIPLATPLKCYTTREVVEEVRDGESRAVLERSIEAGRLEVVEVSQAQLARAEQLARRAGTLRSLSRTDLTVIALSLELRDKGFDVIVASDDYKIQATLAKLGIKFTRVRYKGIKPPEDGGVTR